MKKNACIQIKVSSGIKDILGNKLLNFGFNSLSEYLLFSGLNVKIEVNNSEKVLLSNLELSVDALNNILDTLCITDKKREAIIKVIDMLELEKENLFKKEVV